MVPQPQLLEKRAFVGYYLSFPDVSEGGGLPRRERLDGGFRRPALLALGEPLKSPLAKGLTSLSHVLPLYRLGTAWH